LEKIAVYVKQLLSDSSQTGENTQLAKNALLGYTLIALMIVTFVSFFAWGITSILLVGVSVVVAVLSDFAFSLIMKNKGRQNIYSVAVFGFIVGLSYSLGNPSSFAFGSYLGPSYTAELLPITGPWAFAYVALISAVGVVLFERVQGLLKRKYVNPAAAAKLIVLLPFVHTLFLSSAHLDSIPLNGPIGYNYSLGNSSVYGAFGALVNACFGNAAQTRLALFNVSPNELFETLTILKYHGWVGGASSIAVILVGTGLFIVARKYIKWRITLSYFAATIFMSLFMFAIYGGDLLLRVGFELFIGSSIFLAFFMITDPATTPNTYAGQYVFGTGVGVLTILIQTLLGFLGGSILALVIMNISTPLLDHFGTKKTMEIL
jgi:Na+-translocating ferredoxin:NAD+ oxidoreductase RnfD subunit